MLYDIVADPTVSKKVSVMEKVNNSNGASFCYIRNARSPSLSITLESRYCAYLL